MDGAAQGHMPCSQPPGSHSACVFWGSEQSFIHLDDWGSGTALKSEAGVKV